MAITKSQSTVWGAKAVSELIESSFALEVTNQNYQVDASGAKTIKIIEVQSPTITPYVKDTPMVYENLTDLETNLDLDTFRKFSFKVEDLDVDQSKVDFVPEAMVSGAKNLANEADKLFAKMWREDPTENDAIASVGGINSDIPAANLIGSLAVPVAIDATNVKSTTSLIARKLKEQNVNRGEMTVIVPPWYMDLLSDAVGDRLTENTELMSSGVVYQYAGLNLIETNFVEVEPTANSSQIMAFSARAIPMAVTSRTVEDFRDHSQFGDLYRALFAFGMELLHGKEVVVLSAVEA